MLSIAINLNCNIVIITKGVNETCLNPPTNAKINRQCEYRSIFFSGDLLGSIGRRIVDNNHVRACFKYFLQQPGEIVFFII